MKNTNSATKVLNYSTILAATACVWSVGAWAHDTQVSGFQIVDFSMTNNLQKLVNKAEAELSKNARFAGEGIEFIPYKAADDSVTSTLKYRQFYKGVEVLGDQAMFHYDTNGSMNSMTGNSLALALDVNPTVSVADAMKILNDRTQTQVELSEPLKIQIYRNGNDAARLVYAMLTSSKPGYKGQHILMDAHTGELIVEASRECDFSNITYSANTPEALAHVDDNGSPTDINIAWYKLLAKNKKPKTDQSGVNAFNNAAASFAFYKTKFNRDSYDNQGSDVISVVHMGKQMNNAFWTGEFGLMAYGDGDGKFFTDLSAGRDVGGHELTHAVTGATAELVYAAESGALNEMFSDFFGKMIDSNSNDWYIGETVMGEEMKAKGRKALRNMINPEEYNQPGDNESPLKTPTTGPCTSENDRCGVHHNMGIPGKAGALIAQAIGKDKAMRMYYNVLTQRLSPNAQFSDLRAAVSQACADMFGGSDSDECKVVATSFDTVHIQ